MDVSIGKFLTSFGFVFAIGLGCPKVNDSYGGLLFFNGTYMEQNSGTEAQK